MGVVYALGFNEINTRVIIAGLNHPVAFAIAVHLDGHSKRGCYSTIHATTNLLLAVDILTEQSDGIVAAAFAETEEIALGDLRQIGVVGTQPYIGIIVARRRKSLPNPKLPLHRLVFRDGQGKIGHALSFRVELQLLAVVHNKLFCRS